MNQTWENGKKKTNFGPDFGPFGPNLGPKKIVVDFTFIRCYTLSQAIIAWNF